MTERQVGLYARVSSEHQADANTIDSQVAALRAQITVDGFDLRSVLEFVDAGYSGSSLVRPALERLRDVAAAGGLDRLYVHCPDRLARHYAYQVLLLEELTQRGVEVIFLNRPLGHTPEDQLLLHVQGVIAEYERAKFLERSRRGKRHAAQAGRVGVLCHAPYGYRYVNKQEGGGDARFDIVWDEARVVQQVFAWVGHDRCTINAVCRRLHQGGVRTRTGKAHWDHKTIWDMLKNPAYKGEAAFGKTQWTPVGPRLRAPRGRPAHSRRGYSGKDIPTDQWITIPVPALVEAALFEAVQAQLDENRRRARIPEKGSRYLLQGLLVCSQCGYAYCGCTNDVRNAYYSMIKFFVLDGVFSGVVAVSTDAALDSALAPSFVARPSGPLPSPIIRCPAGLARLKSSVMSAGRAHPSWPGDTDGHWQACPLRECLS
jgi:site-specific DNA recombinase